MTGAKYKGEYEKWIKAVLTGMYVVHLYPTLVHFYLAWA